MFLLYHAAPAQLDAGGDVFAVAAIAWGGRKRYFRAPDGGVRIS